MQQKVNKLGRSSKIECKDVQPFGNKTERYAVGVLNDAIKGIYVGNENELSEVTERLETELKINEQGLSLQLQLIKKDQKSTYYQNKCETNRPHRKHPASTPQAPRKYVENNSHTILLLQSCIEYCLGKRTQVDLELMDKKYIRKSRLIPLIENLLLRMSLSAKTNSHNQKYFITEKGKLLREEFHK